MIDGAAQDERLGTRHHRDAMTDRHSIDVTCSGWMARDVDEERGPRVVSDVRQPLQIRHRSPSPSLRHHLTSQTAPAVASQWTAHWPAAALHSIAQPRERPVLIVCCALSGCDCGCPPFFPPPSSSVLRACARRCF